MQLDNPLQSFLSFISNDLDQHVMSSICDSLLGVLNTEAMKSNGKEDGMKELTLSLLRHASAKVTEHVESRLKVIRLASLEASMMAVEANMNRVEHKLHMLDLFEHETAQRVGASTKESRDLYLQRRKRMYVTIKKYRKQLLETQKDFSFSTRREKYRVLQRLN